MGDSPPRVSRKINGDDADDDRNNGPVFGGSLAVRHGAGGQLQPGLFRRCGHFYRPPHRSERMAGNESCLHS